MRVEIPEWVAKDESKLELLHTALIQQCQIMGARPYPYILHRAHEIAVVSFEEKEQIEQMLQAEQLKNHEELDDIIRQTIGQEPARKNEVKMTTEIIGHLLSGNITIHRGMLCLAIERRHAFGALVRAPLGQGYQVYGLIHDIHIDDDGLVRQLVTADNVSEEVMRDNRERRIVPVEMSVLAVGYEQDGKIHHLLPPRPPLSLDVIYLCDEKDVARFTERFGYFRHILKRKEIPIGEVLAAHIQQAQSGAQGSDRGKRMPRRK